MRRGDWGWHATVGSIRCVCGLVLLVLFVALYVWFGRVLSSGVRLPTRKQALKRKHIGAFRLIKACLIYVYLDKCSFFVRLALYT